MKNEHIRDYINYYLDLTTEPQYAIMVKGAWGSGKSWFLENVISDYQKKNPDFKFLKVSLYGINLIEQIEDEFYRQLHPVLSNKALIFGANVLKNTLKAAIKIDIDGDGKSDADVTASVPGISLKAFSREPNGFVLIFDDIERTGIDLGILFGYINHFVEVNGYKAILIANEAEILKSGSLYSDNNENARVDYERKKEKLIARTFEIESDFESACRVFLGEISSSSVAKIFKEDMQSIKAIYQAADFNNLRHLRQYFLDVERIVPLLGKKYVSNTEFMKIFCHQLMIFSMEHRGGNLSFQEFESVETGGSLGSQGKITSHFISARIAKKHSGLTLAERLLGGIQWREIICNGNITEEIIETLDTTRFFRQNNAPAWQFLWSHHLLSKPVMYEKYAVARDNLYSGKINSLAEILMTASILLDLSKKDLTDDTSEEIVQVTKVQIEGYYTRMSPQGISKIIGQINFGEFSGMRGLAFVDGHSAEFSSLKAHVGEAKERRLAVAIPEFANMFNLEMETGKFTLISELYHSMSSELFLYNIPFLHCIKPETFFSNYCQLDPENMRNVIISLHERYNGESQVKKLLPEKDWLLRLSELSEKFIATSADRFTVFHIRSLLENCLSPAVENFSKAQS